MNNIRCIHDVLVRVPKTYEDKIKYGKLELYLDNRFDDVKHTRRFGEVISSPSSLYEKGDIVYFHHNIVRRIRTMGGVEKEAPESVFGEIFKIPCNEIYAVSHKGKITAIAPYCFIKPIERQQEVTLSGLKIEYKDKFIPQYGIVKYGNKELESQGVKEGDTIVFNLNSEYEYPINGELLYRMNTSWIIAHVEL